MRGRKILSTLAKSDDVSSFLNDQHESGKANSKPYPLFRVCTKKKENLKFVRLQFKMKTYKVRGTELFS